MEYKILNRIEELEPYRHTFDEILRVCKNDNPFITPDWIIRWWKFFGKGRELFAVVMEQDQIITGYCPLMITSNGIYREVNFIGYPDAGYMDFIVSDEHREALVIKVCELLSGLHGHYIINLHGISEQSPSLQLLENNLQKNRNKYFFKTIDSFVIHNSGQGFESLYKSRCSHHSIKNIKRWEKRLKELGNLTWGRQDTNNIDEIFELHEKRWLRKNDGNGFAKGIKKEFFRSLVQDDGILSFKTLASSLRVNGRIIGLNYGFECNGRYMSLRIAHDDDFAVFGPGRLVTKNMVQECFEKGLKVFDFSTGYEKHKKDWTDDKVKIHSIIFVSAGIIPNLVFYLYLAENSLREYFKRFSPLVGFKKVTIGRIKYFFSKENFSYHREKLKNKIYNKGLFTLLAEVVPYYCKKSILLRDILLSGPINTEGSGYKIRPLALEELDRLSELMDTEPQNVTKRLYKGHKCFVAEYDGRLTGYAWVSRPDAETGLTIAEAYIYEVFIQKKSRNSPAGVCLLSFISEYLQSDACNRVYALIACHDSYTLSAAERMDFRPVPNIVFYKGGN